MNFEKYPSFTHRILVSIYTLAEVPLRHLASLAFPSNFSSWSKTHRYKVEAACLHVWSQWAWPESTGPCLQKAAFRSLQGSWAPLPKFLPQSLPQLLQNWPRACGLRCKALFIQFENKKNIWLLFSVHVKVELKVSPAMAQTFLQHVWWGIRNWTSAGIEATECRQPRSVSAAHPGTAEDPSVGFILLFAFVFNVQV